MKVVVYTIPGCTYCTLVKQFLKKHNVKFEEKKVSIKKNLEDVKKKDNSGKLPVTIIDNKTLIRGFDKAKLKKAFNIKN